MSEPEQNNLSPWSHPKARYWFETILQKSGFVEEIEDQVNQAEALLDVESGRLLLAILAMMGRPGMWPKQHKRVLAKAANTVNRMAGKSDNAGDATQKKRPITLGEHQRQEQAKSALATEVEIVRRWGGMSNRSTEIKQPEAWGKFWG